MDCYIYIHVCIVELLYIYACIDGLSSICIYMYALLNCYVCIRVWIVYHIYLHTCMRCWIAIFIYVNGWSILYMYIHVCIVGLVYTYIRMDCVSYTIIYMYGLLTARQTDAQTNIYVCTCMHSCACSLVRVYLKLIRTYVHKYIYIYI